MFIHPETPSHPHQDNGSDVHCPEVWALGPLFLLLSSARFGQTRPALHPRKALVVGTVAVTGMLGPAHPQAVPNGSLLVEEGGLRPRLSGWGRNCLYLCKLNEADIQ